MPVPSDLVTSGQACLRNPQSSDAVCSVRRQHVLPFSRAQPRSSGTAKSAAWLTRNRAKLHMRLHSCCALSCSAAARRSTSQRSAATRRGATTPRLAYAQLTLVMCCRLRSCAQLTRCRYALCACSSAKSAGKAPCAELLAPQSQRWQSVWMLQCKAGQQATHWYASGIVRMQLP